MRPLGPRPTVTSKGRGHDRSRCQGALEKAAFPVFLMVALGIGTPVLLRANLADILLVDGKIVTWDATSSISDALANAKAADRRAHRDDNSGNLVSRNAGRRDARAQDRPAPLSMGSRWEIRGRSASCLACAGTSGRAIAWPSAWRPAFSSRWNRRRST